MDFKSNHHIEKGSEMSTSTRFTIKLARETLPLLQDARRSYVLTHPTLSPSDSAAIGYAIYLVERFKRAGGTILWDVLMSPNFDFGRFALPYAFPCDIRYQTTIERAILPTLDRFCENELRPFFKGEIYRNFVVRAAVRAAYCLTHEGFKDVLIVAGDAVPADAPAAYDPYRLMFPYRSDPRNSEGIDPSIFDQSDLFPNGKVDAEDFADDSELF